MEIKDVTPPPVKKVYRLDVDEIELDEIRIAFTHMLGLPNFYCNDQRAKVTIMRDQINKIKGER